MDRGNPAEIEEIVALLTMALDGRAQPAPLPAVWAQLPEIANLYDGILVLRQVVVALASGDLAPEVTRRGFVAGALKGMQFESAPPHLADADDRSGGLCAAGSVHGGVLHRL